MKNAKIFRSMSGVLALVMIFGVLICFPTISVEAALDSDGIIAAFLEKDYSSPEARVADMELMLSKYNYELYADEVTGEVALKDTRTGNILLSNPYDTAGAKSSQATKARLLSQVIITFSGAGGGSETTYLSAEEAADRGQITIEPIKSGIRVEYAIGRTEVRRLVPRIIRSERYETLIQPYITDERAARRMAVFYSEYDPAALSDTQFKEIAATYPALRTSAIYVFDEKAQEREKIEIEQYIKTYCPHYSYEDMEDDHLDCLYEDNEKAPPLFKLALEYYLEEDGMSVHLPANSIRYSMTDYQLKNLIMLPYMGAGSGENTGYCFVPDGSGTLLRYEDLVESGYGISGKIYGMDYTYNTLSGAHQEVMRMPVFGAVEDQNYMIAYDKQGNIVIPDDVVLGDEPEETSSESVAETEEEETAPATDANGQPIPVVTDSKGNVLDPNLVYEEVKKTVGFLAVIEGGEALTTLAFENGGLLHKYNSSYITIVPRPSDSYNLAESMSIGENASWTVIANRKFTGTYKIKYMMLTSDEDAKKNNITDYHEASYFGMADAYRDYLKSKGLIGEEPMEVDEDIPLYIETFGATETQKNVLSFPVTVQVPLTTFDDMKAMTETLQSKGVNNLHYRLTGFANGGMVSSIPYKVKFEKVVGGDDGMIDFVAYAAEKGVGVYPDFDFVYCYKAGWFDGFSYRDDATQAINGTYALKREYDAALQTFQRTNVNLISANAYAHYLDKFLGEMEQFGLNSVSVSTLGSDVNTDFDKEDPLTREDSKSYTVAALKRLDEAYGEVMIDGGNAYALPYADHVLNVSLDSSRYTKASNSVPFFGLVYHGHLNFAGTPTNMAGDINRELLKIIENGASPYFVLAAQNTELLKEKEDLSQYYSINYEIWVDDLVEQYQYINEALKDVQDAEIVGHRFVEGTRVPSEEELANDEIQKAQIIDEIMTAAAIAAEKAAKAEALAARREQEAAEELAAMKGETVAVETEVAELPETAETGEETGTETDAETAPESTGPVDYLAVELPAVIPFDENGNPVLPPEQHIAYEIREILSKYDVTSGSIVEVSFANGVTFVLNYNDFAVKTADGDVLEAYAYLKTQR